MNIKKPVEEKVRFALIGIYEPFSVAMVREAIPDVSYDVLHRVLKRLQANSEIEQPNPVRCKKAFYVKTKAFRVIERPAGTFDAGSCISLATAIQKWRNEHLIA